MLMDFLDEEKATMDILPGLIEMESEAGKDETKTISVHLDDSDRVVQMPARTIGLIRETISEAASQSEQPSVILFNEFDAARFLGILPNSLRELVANKQIKVIKEGEENKFSVLDLVRFSRKDSNEPKLAPDTPSGNLLIDADHTARYFNTTSDMLPRLIATGLEVLYLDETPYFQLKEILRYDRVQRLQRRAFLQLLADQSQEWGLYE